jgi:hypothetical protein
VKEGGSLKTDKPINSISDSEGNMTERKLITNKDAKNLSPWEINLNNEKTTKEQTKVPT